MSKNTFIVTGASQGIGAEIALKLSLAGYHTLLLARNVEKLQQTVALIHEKGGKATYYPCDVADAASVKAALSSLEKDWQHLPLNIVNNAGWGGPFHKANEVSEEEWDKVFNTNVKSCFLFCRQLLPLMKAHGFGRIINISSIYGYLGGSGSSTYAASKHALIGYTKSIAVEWGSFGITANCISPGYIQTQMSQVNEHNKNYFDAVFKQVPSGKMGSPSDIADLVTFLAKPSTAYINGENMVVDGGLSAGFDFR